MIDETREFIYCRDNWQCQYEGCKSVPVDILQLAHRISKGLVGQKYVQRYLLEKYDLYLTLKQVKEQFIHNSLNMVTSCPKHNDYFNVLFNPEEANKIIDAIYAKNF